MTALTRQAPLLVLLAALAAPAVALVSQYGFGLHPCTLCLWQRWPYAVAALAALACLPAAAAPVRTLLLAVAALAFAATAGIGAFHVGVEQHWWEGLSTCSAETGTADSLEALRAQILAAPVVRCDEVAFAFAGLSMAGWNVVYALAAGLFAAAAAWRARPNGPDVKEKTA